MPTRGRKLHTGEQAASSVEYGLLVTLIAAVIMMAVLTLGGATNEAYSDACTGIRSAVSATGQPVSATC